MKLAIDIGSNTSKCLLGEKNGGRVKKLFEKSTDCRIFAGGNLVENAADMITSAVEEFIVEAKKASSEFKIDAVATSAMREASDSPTVCEDVCARTGVRIRVIGGREEAELAYAGALTDPLLDSSARNSFFDLGGGSMEFVLGAGGEVKFCQSFPIGAVAMTRKFLSPDAVSECDLRALSDYVSQTLYAGLKSCPRDFQNLIAAGGAAVAARFMKQKMNLGGAENIISLADMKEMLARISPLTSSRRVEVYGVPKGRADILPAAFVCIIELLNLLEMSELTHTFHNMRYGMIIKE